MIPRLLFPLFLAALLPLAASAQDAPDAATLGKLADAYEQAIRSGDVSKTGIRQSLARDFSAALPTGQIVKNYGELTKAENALRTLVGRGAVYGTVDVALDPKIEASGDLAVFSGRTENAATAQGGKSRAFTTFWTAVARREEGQWKLVRHQAVMDPASNPWHTEEAGGGPGWTWVLAAGFLGGAGGLALGLAGGFLLGKGRALFSSSSRAAAAKADKPAAPATPAQRSRAWENTDAAPSAAATPEDPATSVETPVPHSAPPASPPTREPASPPPAAPRSSRKRAWE